MPWHIEKREDEFCVIKDADGSTEKCHPTQDQAKKHMAALYANEPEAANRAEQRLPIEMRAASVGGVDFPHRMIDVLAVPYGQEAVVEYRGEVWNESFDRGSFDGVETRAGKIKAYRDHDPNGGPKVGLVGRAVALYPGREEGLGAAVHIAKTDLGDETLSLADEGILSVSIGFGVRGSDQILDRMSHRRRIRKAFLDHLAFPDNGAYEESGAGIISVRSRRQEAEDLPRLDTPLLDDVVSWMESRRQQG